MRSDQTLIYILLSLILLSLIFISKKLPEKDLQAGSGIQNINISRIGGVSLYNKIIDVREIKK